MRISDGLSGALQVTEACCSTIIAALALCQAALDVAALIARVQQFHVIARPRHLQAQKSPRFARPYLHPRRTIPLVRPASFCPSDAAMHASPQAVKMPKSGASPGVVQPSDAIVGPAVGVLDDSRAYAPASVMANRIILPRRSSR